MSDGVFTHYNPADGNPADYSSPDIIERAEAAMKAKYAGNHLPPAYGIAALVPELLAALKAARAQRDQDLEDFAKNYVYLHQQLQAARAENEQLRGQKRPPPDKSDIKFGTTDCLGRKRDTQREMIYGDD